MELWSKVSRVTAKIPHVTEQGTLKTRRGEQTPKGLHLRNTHNPKEIFSEILFYLNVSPDFDVTSDFRELQQEGFLISLRPVLACCVFLLSVLLPRSSTSFSLSLTHFLLND